MFIAQVVGKSSIAQEERHVPCSNARCFAPLELQSSLGAWFYKYLVSAGRTEDKPELFVARTLETPH